jgi:hypothetical protein
VFYGEARALVKRDGKPRTFATFAEAKAEANRLQADLAVDDQAVVIRELMRIVRRREERD